MFPTNFTICFWYRNYTRSYIFDGITFTSLLTDAEISLFTVLAWSISDSSNTLVLFQNFILWRLECFETSITGLRRLFQKRMLLLQLLYRIICNYINYFYAAIWLFVVSFTSFQDGRRTMQELKYHFDHP